MIGRTFCSSFSKQTNHFVYRQLKAQYVRFSDI